MKITTLTGISQLSICDSITLYGTNTDVIVPSLAIVEEVLDSIRESRYPLPLDIEIVLLPFRITAIDDILTTPDGLAHYSAMKVYLSAFWANEFNQPFYAQEAWQKTLAHELGHLVHAAYLPHAELGVIQPMWQTFRSVHGVDHANTTYENSLAEAFAESWRLLFCPITRYIGHRHWINWRIIGLEEWMRSLDGTGVMSFEHFTMYRAGKRLPIDRAPEATNGRTMVPVRHMAELLGCEADWIPPRIVTVKLPPPA